MANICENELHVYTEDPKNLEAITKFFNEEFYHSSSIDDKGENQMTVYFDSRWDFPIDAMNRLLDDIPNKKDLELTCLSVEWGCYYCAFHTFEDGSWVYQH